MPICWRSCAQKPSIRQLYQIAELGKAQGEPTRAPTFMRLTVAPDQLRIEGAGLDYRDEIMAVGSKNSSEAPSLSSCLLVVITQWVSYQT
jgi:hypothetical protein